MKDAESQYSSVYWIAEAMNIKWNYLINQLFGWKVSKEMREPIVTGLFVGISCTYCYKVIKGSG